MRGDEGKSCHVRLGEFRGDSVVDETRAMGHLSENGNADVAVRSSVKIALDSRLDQPIRLQFGLQQI